MKKAIILLTLLCSLSFSSENNENEKIISGEIEIQGSANFGVEGTRDTSGMLPSLIFMLIPSFNPLDESVKTPIDFSKAFESSDTSSSGENKNSNSSTTTTTKSKKPKTLLPYPYKSWYTDEEKVAIALLRNTEFNKSINAKIKINPINLSVGTIIKTTPSRVSQKQSFLEVNKALAYLDIDNKDIKVHADLFIKGYTDGVVGFNRYIEGRNLSPKKDGQIDIYANIGYDILAIRPELNISYVDREVDLIGKIGNSKSVASGFSLSALAQYSNMKNKYWIDVDKDIEGMAPGRRSLDWFKEWEIGELKLDESYNKNNSKEGKNGYAAYRYIGIRDISNAQVTGLDGSLRIVGQSTGALYGYSAPEYVMYAIKSKIIPYIFNPTSVEAINGYISDKSSIINLLKLVSDKEAFQKINRLTTDKSMQEEVINLIADDIFGRLGVKREGAVSDFYITHVFPRELRKMLPNLFNPIPYEDTETNKRYMETDWVDFPFISIPTVTTTSPKEKAIVDKVVKEIGSYPDDPDRYSLIEFGSTALVKKVMFIFHDFNNAMNTDDTRKIAEGVIDLVKAFMDIKKGANIKNVFEGLKQAYLFLDELEMIRRALDKPETLDFFDILQGTHIAETEYDAIKRMYMDPVKMLVDKNNPPKLISESLGDVVGGGLSFSFDSEDDKLKFNLESIYRKQYRNGLYENRPKTAFSNKELEDFRNVFDYAKTFNNSFTRIDKKEQQETVDTKLKLIYDTEGFKANLNLGYAYNKISSERDVKDILKFIDRSDYNHEVSMLANKVEMNYVRNDFNIGLNLVHKYEKKIGEEISISLSTKLNYFLNINYYEYGKFTIKKYAERGIEYPNAEEEEVRLEIFSRGKNNGLIKKETTDKNRTGNPEFDNLPEGTEIDISKYSKYLFTKSQHDDFTAREYADDNSKPYYTSIMENYFKKEKVGGRNSIMVPLHIIEPGFDLKLKLKSYTFAYDFLLAVQFKDNAFDGVMVRQTLSLKYEF